MDAPQIVHSRQVIYEGSREIVLEPKEKKSNMYYVYAKGSLQGIYSAVNQAVQMADEELGSGSECETADRVGEGK